MAEQAVLGSLLIDRDAIATVADWLKPEAFYDKINRTLYRAALALFRDRVPCDVVTLSDRLRDRSVLDAVGGVSYLSDLMDVVPTAVHIGYYAETVRAHAARRALIDEAAAIVRRAYADDVDLDEVAGDLRRAVEPFAPLRETTGALLAETVPNRRQAIQDRWDGVIVERVMPTGIKPLDRAMYGGFREEDLAIIAAMSGMGKTSLMLAMAQHAAEMTGKLSVIVSLEMAEQKILDRMGCATAGVPFSTAYPRPALMSLEQKQRRERDEPALMAAFAYLETLPIAILTAQRTTDAILRELDRLAGQHELGMVLIDHLDHLEDNVGKDNDERRFAELAKRCKGIAQRVKIPNVVLAQLNRGVDAKPPYLPDPRYIRGSGRIRELSDVLVMPYRRRAYVELQMLDADVGLDYLPYPRGHEHAVDLFLFKNRNGELATMSLGFEPTSMSFSDASDLRRAA